MFRPTKMLRTLRAASVLGKNVTIAPTASAFQVTGKRWSQSSVSADENLSAADFTLKVRRRIEDTHR